MKPYKTQESFFITSENKKFNSSFFIKTKFKSPRFQTNHEQSDNKQSTWKNLCIPINAKSENNLNKLNFKQQIQIETQLNKSNEMKIIDAQNKELVSDNAILSYYQHYKNLDKVIDQNKFTKTLFSTFTEILEKSQKANLMPSKLGLVKLKGMTDRVNVNNHKYGDKYMQVLSDGIVSSPNIKLIKLGGNRITEQGANILLGKINKQAQEIDLKLNRIGQLGCEQLAKSLLINDSQLQSVNIEDNKLGDKCINVLLKSIQKTNILTKLNISKNILSDAISQGLKDILGPKSQLIELYLHWNQLKAQTCHLIFQALENNKTLKLLDLSWNNLGIGNQNQYLVNNFKKSPWFIQKLMSYLEIQFRLSMKLQKKIKLQCTLIYHVIILLFKKVSSFLKPLKQQFLIYQQNQTIYGFHFSGNYGYVDVNGFLIVNNNTVKSISQNCIANRIQSFEKTKCLAKCESEAMIDNCWICNEWLEVQFKWYPGYSNDDAIQGPVYIHLQFENYKGIYIGDSNNSVIIFKKMTPIRKQYFFFSVNGTPYIADNLKYKQLKVKLKIETATIDDKLMDGFFMNSMNVLIVEEYIEEKKPCIDSESLSANYISKPRQDYKLPKNLIGKKWRKVWLFRNSQFQDWQEETEFILDSCIEQDFKLNFRIRNMIQDETDYWKCYEIMRNNYGRIRDTYKTLSSINPYNEVWCISQSQLLDFCHQCRIIDEKQIGEADVNLKFTQTNNNFQFKSNRRVPDRGLIRFQFIEFIMRIIHEKYLINNLATSFTKGLNLLLQSQFGQIIQRNDHQAWRNVKFWTEECDLVLTHYKPVIDKLFNDSKFIRLDYFISIFKQAELIGEGLSERDLNQAFCLSKMTEIDEINQDFIFEMTIIEFREGLARVSDKISLKSIHIHHHMSIEMRQQQPLYIKLEAIINHLFEKLLNDKLSFQIPKIPLFIDGKLNIEYY